MSKECNESKYQICQSTDPSGTAGRDSHQDVRSIASRRLQTGLVPPIFLIFFILIGIKKISSSVLLKTRSSI